MASPRWRHRACAAPRGRPTGSAGGGGGFRFRVGGGGRGRGGGAGGRGCLRRPTAAAAAAAALSPRGSRLPPRGGAGGGGDVPSLRSVTGSCPSCLTLPNPASPPPTPPGLRRKSLTAPAAPPGQKMSAKWRASLLACEGLSGVCLVPTVASKKMMPKQSSKQGESRERGQQPRRAVGFFLLQSRRVVLRRLGGVSLRFDGFLLNLTALHPDSDKPRSRKEDETADVSQPKKSIKKRRKRVAGAEGPSRSSRRGSRLGSQVVVIKQNGSFQLGIPKNFICDHCFGAFRSSYHLKRHILIHTGEKPFECDVCDMRFHPEIPPGTSQARPQRGETLPVRALHAELLQDRPAAETQTNVPRLPNQDPRLAVAAL
ncbi:unnamed protein product, partial [Bubo scandiacus]